ncbi:MAG: TPR domain protein [Planctomycetota bacterium]|nr:MAG: TPR domain protein [Planctomycetota bacterium]
MPNRHVRIFALLFAIAVTVAFVKASNAADKDSQKHPLSDDDRATLRKQWDEGLAEVTKKLDAKPDDLAALSKRGDLCFFRGEFAKSVRDYERMSELNPSLDASHWRLGIAYFYADQPEKSAKQFEKFFITDDVDREAGLWKYIAQAPTLGTAKARAGLLKYKKDDREPLPTIYRLRSMRSCLKAFASSGCFTSSCILACGTTPTSDRRRPCGTFEPRPPTAGAAPPVTARITCGMSLACTTNGWRRSRKPRLVFIG